MMALGRFFFFGILLFFWVLLGLAIIAGYFSWCSIHKKQPVIRWWSRQLLRLCRVQVELQGAPAGQGTAALWVANHVSWLDIFVINAVRSTHFVAKSEIRRWPLLGWLVAGSGTVFIERQRRHAIKAVSEQLRALFEQGQVVGLFPEGTTSDGLDVQRFHSSLFATAIDANVPLQTIALRFYAGQQRSIRFAFTGEQNLLANLWYLLGSKEPARVQCVFVDALSAEQCANMTRAEISRWAWNSVRQAVVDESTTNPA
ncbi:MAG TPA: lysophospholipid acyltransferase family protein [Paenalcaligenes sp.]|nr:lysophospholipid acyltransferase family protein [Paenalcaligenes sp.]